MLRLRYQSVVHSIFGAIFIFASGYFTYVLFKTIQQPPLDLWGFRPAQTLISVPYMLSEGGWLKNIVPVFGEPWLLPQEFPLYQWIVAISVKLSGISVSAAGRIVSAFFAVACVVPIYLIGKTLTPENKSLFGIVVGALWLTSPAVIFWGRSTLIETTAIFLSLFWLYFYINYIKNGALRDLTLCILVGSLASTVKITAFAGFVVAGFLYSLVVGFYQREHLFAFLKRFMLSGLCVIIPAIALLSWGHWTSSVWKENPLASMITVGNHLTWYFGVPSDRWDSALWSWVIGTRTLPDYFGRNWIFLVFIFAAAGIFERRIPCMLALSLCFISGYIIFPRLFMYNIYYEIETVVFILAIFGVVICAVFQSRRYVASLLLLALALWFQIDALYTSSYGTVLASDLRNHPYYMASEKISAVTDPQSVVIVFGTGWGADIPLLSERRGIVISNMFEGAAEAMLFTDRAKWLGGRHIGAIVDCNVFQSQTTSSKLQVVKERLVTELANLSEDFVATPGPDMVPSPHCRVYLVK
ncbi:glycosyltransferase family 39 protein [Rhizobium sp. R693]|uniref:ArnT family glycosyltransferase n=1 Tax=Rhizobium sp. R693 TaxID=1764276 RepID=UPI000B530630|nr:glycosyltransferase family 39 protein [Rhizobium sp. R693]OWV88969.1 hypothetical protein ATY79_29055 [Rhizobium sp. R693]